MTKQELEKSFSGKTYVWSEEALACAPTGTSVDIEFVSFSREISCEELEKEIASRGLMFCGIDQFIDYVEKNKDEKRSLGIQWKDANGKFCCAICRRRSDERRVYVSQSDSVWRGRWFFPCVRKSSGVSNSTLSDTLSLEDAILEDAIKVVKEAGFKVIKEY